MVIDNVKGKSFIFVSYAHKDSEIVLPMIKELQKNYYVWYDEGIDPGTEWDENIASHIEECSLFFACISSNYLNSSNCKDELDFARSIKTNRVLIYFEDVELSSGMKMRLNRLQNIHKHIYEKEEDFYRKLYQSDGIKICLKPVTKNIDNYTFKSAKTFDDNGGDGIDLSLKQQALKLFIEKKTAAMTLLQIEFRIGFAKAAKILDWMLQENYIIKLDNGKYKVNITMEQFEQKFGGV